MFIGNAAACGGGKILDDCRPFSSKLPSSENAYDTLMGLPKNNAEHMNFAHVEDFVVSLPTRRLVGENPTENHSGYDVPRAAKVMNFSNPVYNLGEAATEETVYEDPFELDVE